MSKRKPSFRLLSVLIGVAAVFWLTAACGGDPATKSSRDCQTYEEKPMTAEERTARKQYVAQMEAKAIEIRPKYDDLFWRQPKYDDLFWRQPNVLSVGIGLLTCLPPVNGRPPVGFDIVVSEKVDQSTLPEEDRIPDVIEGVPVQISEGTHLEFLGGR